MGGELVAESREESSGSAVNKVTFTIKAYSNERSQKELDMSGITQFDQIKTLIISGSQNRDEELMTAIHKLGLSSSVTTFQRSTASQIKANLSLPTERYNMIIITDDEDFDGFEVARTLWDNRLALNFVMMMVSSNDKKGNYLRCITFGIDHYLVKPFDVNELCNAIQASFSGVENLVDPTGSEELKKDIHILLVEDDKMNQKTMTKMLEILGYSTDIAENGKEGYNKAISNKYDIIFMDIIMPEMDGYESARRILEYYKNCLIVAITADNMPDSRRKAELSGIKEFLSKPVRLEDLKRLFAEHFNK